ncbi:MAG: tripartite tricarboxylate transporter substrate binding protein [Burkholderiales bacterium]|nr:tripartite tricarboxylate transporter substrate binding protein [Burkholderiales bacterium]
MRLLRTLLASLACLAPIAAPAQPYPAKPVRLVVGFPPGGPTDNLARVVGTALGKALGQSVIVDNRPGAGGLVSLQTLAKQEADGYTILFASDGQMGLLNHLYPKAGLDVRREFVPIRMVAAQSNVLMVNAGKGIGQIEALIGRARAAPGKLAFGSGGIGTPSHLVGLLFESATGTTLLHVPYKGAAMAMTDLIAGQVEMMFVGISVALQQAAREQLRAIAVTGARRAANLPQVPTFEELGVKGLADDVSFWWAVAVPAATPAPVRARLDAALRAAQGDPELRQAFQTQGLDATDLDAAATAARIERDHARWGEMVRAGRIKAE